MQKPKNRPAGIVARAMSVFLVTLATLLTAQSAAAAIYKVDSTSLSGTGSFLEAIDLANNNPGPDIIEFTSGLQVDATVPSVGPSNSIMAHITESVSSF